MDIMSFNKSKREEMILTLYGLIDNWEDEVVEFKEAGKDYDRDRIVVFNEDRVFDDVCREGLFPQFSNSYLVELSGE